MLESAAHLYSEVFAPEFVVLFAVVALVALDWRSGARESRELLARVGVVAVAWAVAYAIYSAGPALFAASVAWRRDFVGSLGLAVGMTVIWATWRRLDWGVRVREFAVVLLAMTAVHLAITPFWDVSSHVAYAAAPAGYLVAVDRRFAPTLLVPIGMVVARPLADAHTWLESIGGLVLGAVAVWAVLAALDRSRPTQSR